MQTSTLEPFPTPHILWLNAGSEPTTLINTTEICMSDLANGRQLSLLIVCRGSNLRRTSMGKTTFGRGHGMTWHGIARHEKSPKEGTRGPDNKGIKMGKRFGGVAVQYEYVCIFLPVSRVSTRVWARRAGINWGYTRSGQWPASGSAEDS